MLPVIGSRERTPIDARELILGLNCGGSDGYSGITANPALGVASDLLVGLGGTSVLAETPEIFGAEHLLTRRAVSAEVGQKLLDRIDWWQGYVAAVGGTLDNNPSPGNKRGGLTTILEKSLGAVAKGGQAELTAVYEYAERIDRPGFGFMDTPGYDPVSVTGLVAGGANIVCFTTGRGSVFGCKPAPSIKIGTNSELAASMPEDMDINAGTHRRRHRDRDRGRPGDLRPDPRRRLRHPDRQRGARHRPGRVRPVATRRGHLSSDRDRSRTHRTGLCHPRPQNSVPANISVIKTLFSENRLIDLPIHEKHQSSEFHRHHRPYCNGCGNRSTAGSGETAAATLCRRLPESPLLP